MPETLNLTAAPAYCRKCNSRGSYSRYPQGDIKTVSGKTLYEKWKCSCGQGVIQQVKAE